MRPDWIAVDWGTTNLRAWAMGPSGICGAARSGEGIGHLAPGGFERALLALIGPWLSGPPVPVLACGMVGSRQGWCEAPYRAVPCAPVSPDALATVPVADPRITVRIVPGLRQTRPADVMRGEETQIAGALALRPAFDGTMCLPGTHSKWARVCGGEVAAFETHLTGELFSLLTEHSVLRHGLAEGWDDAAFDAGAAEGAERPERLAALLFRIRAEGLIAGLGGAAARARLSGLLIGAELAAARGWWLGLPVLLIGSPRLAALYARALAARGVTATTLDAADCTIAGLARVAGALTRATA
jgi:2-dehydro-3-deoxygalactonokinase